MMLSLLPPVKSNLTAHSRKLLIIPGDCQALGGTLISLGDLMQGFAIVDRLEELWVAVRAGSLMEKYLTAMNLQACLYPISAKDDRDFLHHALNWAQDQPIEYPLLLHNCVARQLLLTLGWAAPKLRFSRRPVYHFCHDLALSHNRLGFLARKLVFNLLAPHGISNSCFTAKAVAPFIPDIQDVLYQPVDCERFFPTPIHAPPHALQPILNSGARIILNPSRITAPGIINDKNLRALLHVLAYLRSHHYHYHLVMIGEDDTPNRVEVKRLQDLAQTLGVEEYLTILPPVFEIEQYYQHADIVIALAPREPFGRIVIEAIAAGLPVVGSETGGIGEILNHFAPEWCVDAENTIEVAEKVLSVIHHPNKDILITKGQAWVKQHCSLVQYAQKMMQITGINL